MKARAGERPGTQRQCEITRDVHCREMEAFEDGSEVRVTGIEATVCVEEGELYENSLPAKAVSRDREMLPTAKRKGWLPHRGWEEVNSSLGDTSIAPAKGAEGEEGQSSGHSEGSEGQQV